MDKTEKCCRLCAGVINDENFKVIDDAIKSNLCVLLLKLNFTWKTQHVMCRICSEKLKEALNFKTACLQTDKTIFPYVDLEKLLPVDLKDVYMKEKGSKVAAEALVDKQICRLCMQPTVAANISQENIPSKAIEIYIPEMTLNLTIRPVICIECHNCLLTHSNFIRNCKRVNEEMTSKNETENIKTEEVYIKLEKRQEESDDTNLFYTDTPFETAPLDIKREETKEESLVKMSFTAEQDAFILLAHFRSGTQNPDGSWTYSLQSCMEQFAEEFPDTKLNHDIFINRRAFLTERFEEKNCICKGKSSGKCPDRKC